MAQLLVGDSECTFNELTKIFAEPSIAATIISEWTSLARSLDTPLHITENYRQELLLRMSTHSDVVKQLLVGWRLRMSKEATLGNLLQKIPDSLKLIKDMLQDKIREKAKCWNDLDKDSKNIVMQTKVNFLGRIYSVSSLRDVMNEDKFDELFNKAEMKELFSKSFRNEDWDLGHYDIPKPLSYYIPRKLTIKRRLNPAIFKHKCSDIFLIEGIQHHHLSILARPELTDVSSDQLNKVTRRFILLEHPEDYNEIVKVAKCPVHRIQHQDDQFLWLSTSGSCQIIRVFLTNDAEEIEEKTLIKDRLVTFNNRPIAICSSPGMGKSVLLANLAHEMIKAYPHRITIYLKLSSLIPMLSTNRPILVFENIKQILVSSSSISLIGKEILLEFLDKNDMTFEIFLDGFDEITLDCMKTAKCFLKYLLKCTNMRVYITSRPHMQNDIENTLEVISLNISPFDQENQVNFLQSFWTLNANIVISEKLSQFTVNVLKSLEFINQSNTSQTEFAGIPLQCFMLAQVYAIPAKMYCNRDHFNFEATNSLFDLYEEFINLKFQNIEKRDRNLVKMYHWKEALLLLFPDNPEAAKIVQELTRSIKTKRVPWNKIFTVGILEYAPDKPNFVHRTFAEYLLAEFIVKKLLINEVVDINISLKFILDSVIAGHETTKGHILSLNDINHISKYIESSESWVTGKLDLKKLKNVLISNFNFPLEGVENHLSKILFKWKVDAGANASVDILGRAFELLDCGQLVEDLHKNVFQAKRVLQNEMVCTFIDAALGKNQTTLVSRKLTHFKYDSENLSRECYQLKWKLSKCTQLGYQFLTKTLVDFYCDASVFKNVLKLDYGFCEELLISASFNNNVVFFKFICNTIKLFTGLNFKRFFKKSKLQNMMCGITLLDVSISKGNYKLVEYLISIIGDGIKKMNSLWLGCFFYNRDDSRNVIVNKVKILKLLTSIELDFQIETMKNIFKWGVNLELLTVLYDLHDYAPSEKDVKYMIISVQICCKNCSEIDYIVNWLFSKNLAHLLTVKYLSYCMLSAAVAENVLRPETLSMVYRKYSFQLGIIFPFAAVCKRNEAIVKTIIELSNDVNLVDNHKNTLLHWAALFRKFNLIKYLVSIGANVNFRNIFGNNPLYNVFQYIDTVEGYNFIHDIVSLFVSNKADVWVVNIAGISALDLANVHRDKMCIEDKTLDMLKRTAHRNKSLESKFFEVFKNSNEVSINMNNVALFDMFMDSFVCKCSLAFVKNIVEISGNVNLFSSSKMTLLHFAALFGDLNSIEFLLLNGANTNLKDNYGQTPLSFIFGWSIRRDFEVLVSLNTNTQWIHECVQLLLEHNADVSVKDNKGQTPLDFAQELKNTMKIEDRTINLLIERFQRENEID